MGCKSVSRSGAEGSDDMLRCTCLEEHGELVLRYNNMRDEKYLRRVVLPLELILTNYPRVVVKDLDGSVYEILRQNLDNLSRVVQKPKANH